MKPRALFLSNEIYFDASKKEGGVRVCTEEYLALIEKLFDVEVFKVSYHISFTYRLRVKLGLNIYNDYQPEQYAKELEDVIRTKKIELVFLNLSNTAPFAAIIKAIFGNQVKVILCSHGNESGDYLHEATRFQKKNSFFRGWFSSYALGHMLKKEAEFRQKGLDAVLTVSPVEEALENWLGAKQVLMVPRTVTTQFLTRNPVAGRVGFIGDLSHAPNFFGIDEVCKAIELLPSYEGVNLRLVGAPEAVGERLAAKYPFVNYLGYMDNDSLQQEVSSWTYFLNPVFYYSRGVSTKLAKAFGWGIPVITTKIGCRGYIWRNCDPVMVDTPGTMAKAIQELSNQSESFEIESEQIRTLVTSIPDMEENSKQLALFLKQL
ncbi:glycosyltransferase involved in cell wall biosynthesis [Algoriphagus boseongensis]|uniref:Glycosyltransferase involved in cell wall biosynthesis n=1 Tax=Algoriphagus boseongensis TaxID=1442587 RepID=A0A4V6PW66_9BACT|nr:glycosyltransferase [Algoriphagus boseongensis]TDQ19367.1 glycosyltransferase involved in cell wall biosynthesis [Algoriphagus boseongensis]